MMREYENYEETAYRPEYWEDEEDTRKQNRKTEISWNAIAFDYPDCFYVLWFS